MVPEQAQEMHLAHWLPMTPFGALAHVPSRIGLWLAGFPAVETLGAQLIAAALVLTVYMIVNMQLVRTRRAGA